MKYGFESFESEPEVCYTVNSCKVDALGSISASAELASSALNSISNAISSNDCCTFNWVSDTCADGGLSMINMSDSLSNRLSDLEAKFDKYIKSFDKPFRNLRSQLKTLTGEWKNEN